MNKLIPIIIIIAVLLGLYYLIYPAFRVTEVNDVIPTSPISPVNVIENSVDSSVSNTVVSPVIDVLNNAASEVIGTAFHPAEGTVRVIEINGKKTLRFENFKTIDGPRLNVYLSRDKDATDFIDLGYRKGTSGNIHYTIPDDVNLDEYKYVLHWCVPFNVLFNYALLEG